MSSHSTHRAKCRCCFLVVTTITDYVGFEDLHLAVKSSFARKEIKLHINHRFMSQNIKPEKKKTPVTPTLTQTPTVTVT